jgi:hypothetical protein
LPFEDEESSGPGGPEAIGFFDMGKSVIAGAVIVPLPFVAVADGAESIGLGISAGTPAGVKLNFAGHFIPAGEK